MTLRQLHWVWLPIIAAQGIWVKLLTPRLPEAAPPIEGVIEGREPVLDLVVIGESPVAGIGAPTHALALTGQTAQAWARRTGRSVRWLALGRSGATVRTTIAELVPQLAGRRADAVVIGLGVNDALDRHSASRWCLDLNELILAVRDQVGHVPIVLAGVPPLDRFPAFPEPLRSFLGGYSKTLDRATAEFSRTLDRVVYAPMSEGIRPDHFCVDRFHPGVTGYALWGEHLSQFLPD